MKIVLDIFERFARGESQDSITRSLNEGKIPVWGRGARWNRSYIFKIITSEAVLGVLKMGRKRKADRVRTIVESIPDYYPAIIDTTLFEEANRRIKAGTKGRQTTKNPLQGILRCPHCEGLIIREWKGEGSRAKLVCGSVRAGSGTPDCTSIRIDLETYWSEFKAGLADKAKDAAKAFHPAPVNTLRRDAETARAELVEMHDAVASLHKPSAVLIGQITKMESHVQELEADIRSALRDSNLGWENLLNALDDETTDAAEMSARLRVVYPDGVNP